MRTWRIDVQHSILLVFCLKRVAYRPLLKKKDEISQKASLSGIRYQNALARFAELVPVWIDSYGR